MKQSMTIATISFLLFTLAASLTITSPSAGDSLDPTQPITVQWISTSSDPATFDLILDNTNQNSLVKNKKVATSISTSSGSYILSTAMLMTYGAGFVFKAEDSAGNVLSTSGAFDMATGVTPGISSSTNGRIATVSPSTSMSSSSDDTSMASFFAQTTGTDITSTQMTATGMASQSTATTPNTMTASNGFFTSTTSRATSGTRSVASSAASATTSANAQPRTGSSSQIVFSAAGILAGLVALLA